MSDLKHVLAKLAEGRELAASEAEGAFETLMSGAATPGQIGAFLMGLRVRGETVDEIAAGARVMRAKALAVDAPADALDTCGTGGDASGTWNISTAVALICAACSVPVAKHGNKALSSKSGSAEVLQKLGVRLDVPPARISHCIREAGIGFIFAPAHHDAMRHVGPVRQELGTRTIFNLLGPLSNPAGAKRQLLGVFAERWVVPLAQVLQQLGSTSVWVVHGSDGLDELTTTAHSHVAALKNGAISTFTVAPEDAGLARAKAADLVGGDPETNAQALKELLDGARNPYRDIVLLNSAAALIVAGKADTLATGVQRAGEALDSGASRKVLETLVRLSNEPL